MYVKTNKFQNMSSSLKLFDVVALYIPNILR